MVDESNTISEDTRYVSAVVFATGAILFHVLATAFGEAGLAQSARYADGITVLWMFATILHFDFIRRGLLLLGDSINSWRQNRNAN